MEERIVQRIVGLLLVTVLAIPPWALAADAFVIVNPAEADSRVAQAAGDALQKCIPFYGTALNIAPEKLDVYIYPSRQAFARGLETHGSYSAAAAAGWARTAYVVEANSNAPALFISQESVRELAPQQVVEVICIGVGIILERQLGGARRITGHQWLRQGYSKFMAASAIDAFGLEPLVASRDRATRALVQIRQQGREFPILSDARTLDGWQAVFERYGANDADAFAFVAADLLTRKAGREAFATYFKSLGYRGNTPPDIDALFQTAFKLPVDQFQNELSAYLATLVK
jgi:hypothetical protein